MACSFPAYYHVQGLLPWLALAGLLVLKPNRKLAVFWIAAVMLLLGGVYMLVKYLLHWPTSADGELNLMFTGLVGSFAAVLLAGASLKRIGLLFVPVLYLGVIALSGVVNRETLDMAIFLALSMLGFYGAYIGAGLACRRRFTIGAFLLWKAIGLMASLLVVFLVASYLFSQQLHQSFEEMLPEVLFCCVISGAIYYVGALPFEILMFVHPFWRKRFEAVFSVIYNHEGHEEHEG